MSVSKRCQQLLALDATLLLSAKLLVTLQALGMELPMPLGPEDTSATSAIILAARSGFSPHIRSPSSLDCILREGQRRRRQYVTQHGTRLPSSPSLVSLLSASGELCAPLPSVQMLKQEGCAELLVSGGDGHGERASICALAPSWRTITDLGVVACVQVR